MVQSKVFFKEKANYFILITIIMVVLFFIYYVMANNELYVMYIFGFVYVYFIYDFYVQYARRFSDRDRYFLRLWPLSILGTFFGLLILGSLISAMVHMSAYGIQDGKTMFMFTLVFALTFFGALSIANIYRNFRGTHHLTKEQLIFVSGREKEEVDLSSILGLGVSGDGLVYLAQDKQELKYLDSLADMDKSKDEFSYRAKQLPIFLTFEGKRLIEEFSKIGYVPLKKLNFILMNKS